MVRLYGRDREEERIARLLAAGMAGRSGAVAVIGEPGAGKSVLLELAAEVADPAWRVLRCVGMESAAPLPYSGLRRLLEPALELLPGLPQPQVSALSAAFGLDAAEDPERFLVGLATLSLLAELSARGPVLCLIDDAQWVDRASLDALLFTARRLGAEGVVMVFAGRPDFTAPGLEVLVPRRLDAEQTRSLLAERIPNLPFEIRERVLAESGGNPLAVLELPGMNLDAPPVGPPELSERLQSGFQEHIAHLPEPTRLALLVAATDESGSLGLVLRVLATLGSGAEPLADAERTGMITVTGQSVLFRHPLVRTAAYRMAAEPDRMAVHAALAAALDGDPDRQAWHLAFATSTQDEKVAAALESAARRARDRTGYAAAASAWERAAQLTPDPAERGRRLVCAIETAWDAGRFQRVRRLAAAAEPYTREPERWSRIAKMLGNIEFDVDALRNAYHLFTDGAARIAEREPAFAAVLLLDASRAAWTLGDPDGLRTTLDMLRALPPGADRDVMIAAVDGTLGLDEPDPSRGIALLRGNFTAPALRAECNPSLRFSLGLQALLVGAVDDGRAILTEIADDYRTHGRLAWLSAVVLSLAVVEFLAGCLREAEALATEGRRLALDIDQPGRVAMADSILALVAAVRGAEQPCHDLIANVRGAESPEGNALHDSRCEWALALLDMGYARYGSALDRLEELDRGPMRGHAQWLVAHADRVEAAIRSNQPERAKTAFERLEKWATALDEPWAEALLLRARGVISGDAADFGRALELHARQHRWFDRARTGLLYGELLRKQRRYAEARTELREAFEAFERLGARPWAEQARTELRAVGESAVPEAGVRTDALSPQELQVARIAAAGATNKEIGARLFISPKTVGHHLSRVFRKLGVSNRVELARLDLD
ncbi:AAA family ATPase [Nocardia yamanashiensis]|uniref:helix-turn-helix transcriptional regulator n=1 Tax=Nocardia yamanashiensis TaxID=209247 RepID=UPI001E28648B|nr:LuxR family transcriptional regulator [Nocardia yamanashiensis]UGT39037.1 AAA family ATPase [Nocardia yamanashiensis]